MTKTEQVLGFTKTPANRWIFELDMIESISTWFSTDQEVRTYLEDLKIIAGEEGF